MKLRVQIFPKLANERLGEISAKQIIRQKFAKLADSNLHELTNVAIFLANQPFPCLQHSF